MSQERASREVPLLCAAHVSDEAGTGLVHTAPAHGPEDFEVSTGRPRLRSPSQVIDEAFSASLVGQVRARRSGGDNRAAMSLVSSLALTLVQQQEQSAYTGF